MIALGRRATMPARMISEMPLPKPYSSICSPSHIRKTQPAVRPKIPISQKLMCPEKPLGPVSTSGGSEFCMYVSQNIACTTHSGTVV